MMLGGVVAAFWVSHGSAGLDREKRGIACFEKLAVATVCLVLMACQA